MKASSWSRRGFIGLGIRASGGALAAAPVLGGALSEIAAASTRIAPRPKTPDEALTRLLTGNARFVAGKVNAPRRGSARRVKIAKGQQPYAVILTCADSRVPPELVFDQGLGDLFDVRVAGNTATDPIVVGSIQYAVANLGSVLVFVLGHSECGAVHAAVEVATLGVQLPGDIGALAEPIIPAVEEVKDVPEDELVDAAVEVNIRRTIAALSGAAVLRDLIAQQKLEVAGGEYDLETGEVKLVK